MIPWLLFLWVWILFQTDFDSSLWRVSREKPSSHPPILPSFPVSAPWTAAASPPKPARGISEVRGPSWPPPRARRGDRPKATPAGLVARDTKTDFPSSASHVCWRRFGVPLPAPRDPSLRKDQTGSSRSGLRERKEGPPPELPPSPRPPVHTSGLGGDPPDRGRELPGPLHLGTPKAHSQNAPTPHLPFLGPSQAPRNQSPFKSGGPGPAPSLLPSYPQDPTWGTDEQSIRGTERPAWGPRGEAERPTL